MFIIVGHMISNAAPNQMYSVPAYKSHSTHRVQLKNI
jgi:hypothetical protein